MLHKTQQHRTNKETKGGMSLMIAVDLSHYNSAIKITPDNVGGRY